MLGFLALLGIAALPVALKLVMLVLEWTHRKTPVNDNGEQV